MPCSSELADLPRKDLILATGPHRDPPVVGSNSANWGGPGEQHVPPDRRLQNGRQVGVKLGVTFGLLIVILLGTAYLALDRMQRVYAGLEAELDESLLELQLAQDGLRYSNENGQLAMQVFLVRPELIDQLLTRQTENSRKISALMPLLEPYCASEEEKQLLQSVKDTRTIYLDSYQQVLRLLLIEKNRSAAAEVMVAQTTPALFRYHAAWEDFARFQFDEVKEVSRQGKQQHATTRRVMLTIDFTVALLAGVIAIIATRQVARVVNSRIRMQQEVYKLNAELERRVNQRTLELQHTEEQLRGSLGQLQLYTNRVETVNKLVQLLQSCLTLDEAYQQASHVLQSFFPEGTLLMLNPSRNLLDVAASWGKTPARQGPFSPDSCWGLRKGRPHVVEPGNFSLLCSHIDSDVAASHICVPMVAQGESLGVLTVSDLSSPHIAADPDKLQRMQELASSLGEQISLALANLMLRETLKYQSVRDPLTNLFNRRHMEEALQRELLRSERNGNPVAVLMADVDRFKQFNDAFGHEAGDALLRDLGALLAAEIRGGDVACRYGGEEFLLILADTDLPTACERAERLRQQVRNLHVRYRGETLRRITMSVGVAGFPKHGTSANQIVTAADRALYQAKAAGRDRVVVAGEGCAAAPVSTAQPTAELAAENPS